MSAKVMNCPHCGKLLPREFWHEKSQTDSKAIRCPRCGGFRNWKDAKKYTKFGVFQRYFCKDCGRRFSNS